MIVTEIVVLAVAAAGLIGFHTFRVRRKLRTLADQIRLLRRTAVEDVHYRPARADETWLETSRERYEAMTRELEEKGQRIFGDLVEEDGSGTARGMARWFGDDDGTICGWLAVLPPERGSHTAMFLFSESRTPEFFVSHLGPTGVHLAVPPFVRRTDHPPADGVAATLQSHRRATSSDREASWLRRTDDLDAAVALVTRLREATAEWRASQWEEKLLVEDLRAILQDRFEKLSPALLRLLK
jgi:hypothetical protein